MQEGAFKIVQQEFGLEKNVLLVTHLMNTTEDDSIGQRDITKVLCIPLKVIGAIQHGRGWLRLFVDWLPPLLDGPKVVVKAWSRPEDCDQELIDGSLLKSEGPEELCELISSIDLSVEPLRMSFPSLNEAEIAGSRWGSKLVTMWSEAVHHKLRDGDRLMPVRDYQI